MSFKPFMFYIGGFFLSIFFVSENGFCSNLQEEVEPQRIFFKPILPGSVRSEYPWTYEEGRIQGPQGQEILPYNQSKLLRDVGKYGLEAVHNLFKQSVLRIIEYDDGTLGLTTNLQLLGGGNGGSSDRGFSGGSRGFCVTDTSNRTICIRNSNQTRDLSSGRDSRDRGSDRNNLNSNDSHVFTNVSNFQEYAENEGYSSPPDGGNPFMGGRSTRYTNVMVYAVKHPDTLLSNRKKSSIDGNFIVWWLAQKGNFAHYGKPYKFSQNQKGNMALLHPKAGLVYPVFVEDRKYTDSFLPEGYPHPYPAKDQTLGHWLLTTYEGDPLKLPRVLIGGVNQTHKGPFHRVLSEGRRTKAMEATFGIVLNILGPSGVRKLSLKYADKDPDLSRSLDEVHRWLGMFKNPNRYVSVSMRSPLSSYRGVQIDHDAISSNVRTIWRKQNLTDQNREGYLGFYEPKNGLLYPVYQDDYRRRGIMLPEGYEPQETHEHLGISFLQACGGCGQEILEEVLGIPKQAQASYGMLLNNPVVQRGCQALAQTIGLSLTTMLGNELFADSVLQKLDKGIYYDLDLIPGLGSVVEFLRGSPRPLAPPEEVEKLKKILNNVAPGDPNDFEPDSEDEDSFDPDTAEYEGADYHHINSKGPKSKAPTNPDKYLKGSIRFAKNSKHRINVDPETGEYIFYSRTQSGKYHGHVKSQWTGRKGFTNQQRRALHKSNKTKLNGEIRRS